MTPASARIRDWRNNPLQFVIENFQTSLDPWQEEALSALAGPYDPRRRLCMKACTGPGKSAVLAWIGWHRLACFGRTGEHPKGAALSVTVDNLRDNLWAELAKWQGRSAYLRAAFTWTKSAIYANDHAETWFLSARSFARDADAEAIGRALSGLHSLFPFILLDETGDMPVSVGRAAMQIFTGSPVDALVAQAGNPTSTSGLLHESSTREGYRVVTVTADPDDPRRTARVSIEHAREMIAQHGRDNPWVMATILGQFPPTGFDSLFGPEEVEAAMNRHYREDEIQHAPVILGGDVARQGDDESVISRRQGLVVFPFRTMRVPDIQLVASQFAREQDKQEADAFFVDETGGYGAGVVDAMRHSGYSPVGVQFSGKSSDGRYLNKRSEMYFAAATWLKNGGALPRDEKLKEELCAVTYVYKRDAFAIVDKDILKKALGRSPDRADAFVLTFAYPVAPKLPLGRPKSRDYDPYAPETEKSRTHYVTP